MVVGVQTAVHTHTCARRILKLKYLLVLATSAPREIKRRHFQFFSNRLFAISLTIFIIIISSSSIQI